MIALKSKQRAKLCSKLVLVPEIKVKKR